MNTKSPLFIVAAIGVLAVAYTVGGNFGDSVRNGFDGGGVAEQSLLSPDDEALQDKLQPYIECLNIVDDALRINYREYRANFDILITGTDSGISSLNQFKIQVYETGNSFSKDCANALDVALKQMPTNDVLDSNGGVYANTLRELIPLMNEADEYYYSQKDYLDDAMAKGKDLDARMAPLFDKLFAASDAISAEVDAQSLVLRQKELAGMEAANGRDFDWHLANVMSEARKLVDGLDAAVGSGALTEAKVQELETALQKAHDDASAYAAANPDATTALGNKPLWFDMQSYAANLLGDVKELRRALAANPAPAQELDSVFGEYNNLVDNYNLQVSIGR